MWPFANRGARANTSPTPPSSSLDYAALDKLPATNITVVLDSCFSGAGGRCRRSQSGRSSLKPLPIT